MGHRVIKRKNCDGFTLIELLLATTVFSILLLLLTQGMIQITRVYLKGNTIVKTQDAAQASLSSISNSIQFSGGLITETGLPANQTPAVFCVNNDRFTYQLDAQLTDGAPTGDKRSHVLVLDQPIGGCNASTLPQDLNSGGPLTATSRELLGTGMRLNKLSVTSLDNAQNVWRVTIVVVYGEVDLLNPGHNGCLASLHDGGQFCSSSQLTTIVQKRVQ
ncbi:MAG: hypothetical protein NVS1B7_2700 [Candidatus Saccharimonadales bacterium]